MTKNRLKILGLNIKFARIKKGLSQEELAELINTSRTTISMIETARQNPTILKVIDISKVLNTDINELVKDV
ncbi:MAG: helix-turn-helix domain-containing protein [Candidatus Gastranaerophilales bacterium]|nr:helix-turn-helix domain-containing protein [Candidatus Gastranaerophilales bacterium]